MLHPAINHKSTSFSLSSSTVFAKFTNALVKSRPLLEIGAEQVRNEIIRVSGKTQLTYHGSS